MAKCPHLDGQNKNRALLDASLHGHEECIELLLKEGADVNAKDGRGNSVLKRASNMGHLTCVKKLIKSGADVNATDEVGDSVLISAAEKGKEECSLYLIFAGANVNVITRNFTRDTTLTCQADMGRYTIVRKEVTGLYPPCKIVESTLVKSARLGLHQRLELLLKAQVREKAQTKECSVALLRTSRSGHVDCMKLLINAGTDVNTTDRYDFTSRMFAASGNHMGCIKLLINLGSDVNKNSSIYRETALLCSIQESNSDREIGANVNSTNARSLTASGVSALKLLLEAGADVNICDISGVSCVMKAAANGNAECTKALLKAGADVNGFSINGVSALMFALMVNDIQCLEILLGTGANVNEQSNYGPTALMYVARRGRTQALKCLLESGADVNFVAANGETALELATKNGHTQCVELLNTGADVNLKLNLKHICRRMIRKHLLKLDRHMNLFVNIPQLGLPSIITEYMLYGVSPV